MTAREVRWGLLVKDITILSIGGTGADWWLRFRDRYEPHGRVIHIPGTATPQGDHCWVVCGDPEDGSGSREGAENLRDLMVTNGVHKNAIAVRRTPKEVAR